MNAKTKYENNRYLRLLGRRVDSEVFLTIASTEGSTLLFGQSGEDAILYRLLGLKRNGIYVDVGAYHPRIYSNTYLLHSLLGWSGINIDASHDTIELFRKERPDDINIHAAVSDKEGETVYWKFKHAARNTILRQNVERQLKRGDTVLVGEETVPMRRLDKILDEHLRDSPAIDLLNIDVEGAELQVLESNNWEKYVPEIILIEDYSVKSEGLDKSAIHHFLTGKGYRFVSHCYDTSIYVSGRFEIRNSHQLEKLDLDLRKYTAPEGSNAFIELKERLERLGEEAASAKQLNAVIKEQLEASKQMNDVMLDKIHELIRNLKSSLDAQNQNLLMIRKSNRELNDSIQKKKEEIEALQRKIASSRMERNRAIAEYNKLKRSRSWRITQPVRALGSLYKSIRG
jgi:FkbM family methyltransferase